MLLAVECLWMIKLNKTIISTLSLRGDTESDTFRIIKVYYK